MEAFRPQSERIQAEKDEILSFWALGDLHYAASSAWRTLHTPRMTRMFEDLRGLWASEGRPAFCVSPGDIIETATPENYQFARQQLSLNLDPVPFYPGLGNHELLSEGQESEAELLEEFTTFWSRPPRYYWVEGEVLCVMLDVVGYGTPRLPDDALVFLETALRKHPRHIALIFAHCPLYNTVLARDQARGLDYDSLEPFFALENSAEVRTLLARHSNACLYVSGHTHTSWLSSSLVVTEKLGEHELTHVNLSSPWYTGRHHGAAWLADEQRYYYRADEPDGIISFSVRVAREQIRLRLRDHVNETWLAEWTLPGISL